MTLREFTVLHLFGGSGGGAIGFQSAEARLFDTELRFRCLGSVDIDPIANADFRRFTGSRTLEADIESLSGAALRAFAGERPDVMFCSAPCKGGSRLLSNEKAKTEKYERMNQLALHGARAVFEAWPEDPPALLLFENVPGLTSRAKAMLRELRALLRSHGYVVNESTHDCGEIGGLAQHRDRWLLVARRPKRCPQLLYKPIKKRVRGCGEVLSELPVPATEAAQAWGVLHELPRLSWTNWLRLALIPAGGDWRNLEGVLRGRARREVFRRHAVADWTQPLPAVTGPGGHSVEAVDDPRVDELAAGDGWHRGGYGVTAWGEPSGTVTGGASHPSRGSFAVGDPRTEQLAFGEARGRHDNKYRVERWDAPAHTVIGKLQPGSGRPSAADPRLAEIARDGAAFQHVDRVFRRDEPVHTITSSPAPSSGRPAVADDRVAELRVERAYDAGYGVLGWDQAARTVAGTNPVGAGAYAVADPRDRSPQREVRVLTLDEALALDLPGKAKPDFVPVIVADDGTWHRPLTLLELAVLQSYPLQLRGERLRFDGTRTQIATHIGNSVPPSAGLGIARQMLLTLGYAAIGGFALSGETGVWVEPIASEVAT